MPAPEIMVWAFGAGYVAAFLALTGRAEREAGRSLRLFGRARGAQRWTAAGFTLGFALLAAWPFLDLAAPAFGARFEPGVLAWIGVPLAAGGAALALGAQAHMGRSWRIGAATGDVGNLVTDGPFAVSRNPVFVGQIALFAALPLASGEAVALAPFLLVAGAALAQARIEERILDAAGGETWRVYASATPRWLGLHRRRSGDPAQGADVRPHS